MKLMNPLAGQLNESIKAGNEHVFEMLSTLGKEIYFPKEGILSQSAEATAHAKKYNATIGIATEGGLPMHLRVIQDKLSAYSPKDLYGYAPPAGKPELRTVWREKMLRFISFILPGFFGDNILLTLPNIISPWLATVTYESSIFGNTLRTFLSYFHVIP